MDIPHFQTIRYRCFNNPGDDVFHPVSVYSDILGNSWWHILKQSLKALIIKL